MESDAATTPLIDALRDLARSGAGGLLTVRGVAGSGHIRLDGDAIVEASSPALTGRLGERLVGAGLLEPTALEAALDRQEGAVSQDRLGTILVDGGLVGDHVIALFVQEQLLDAVFELTGWADVTVDLVEPPPNATGGVPVRLSVHQALEEVDRRRREWHTIRRVVPGLTAVPRRNTSAARVPSTIEPDEQAVLDHVDGNATIGEIADRVGYGAFEAARVVYALLRDGRVEVVGTDRQVHDQTPATGRSSSPPPPLPPPPNAPPRPASSPARAPSGPVDTAEVLRELSRIARGTQPRPEPRFTRRVPAPPEPPPVPDRLARRRRFMRGE